MSKKANEKAKATKANAAKKEEKAKAKAIEAPKAVEAPKAIEAPKAVEAPKRPEMPDNFCMEKADWDGDGVCYDPKSNGCQACAKDKEFAKAIVACIARADFLLAGKKKPAREKAERKARVGGGLVQGDVMNDALKKRKSISEIVQEIANRCYAGDYKSAASRFNRHIKSIKNGTCSKSKEMLPHIAYLSAPTKAEKTTNASA